MKVGALVKIEILNTVNLPSYSYGILVDDEPHDLYDDMEPKNMLIQEERITQIKTFEDW
jgi:hypothetical protein